MKRRKWDAFNHLQEATRAVGAFRVKAEAALELYGDQITGKEKRILQRALWEVRHILGETEAVFAEMNDDPGMSKFYPHWAHVQALYHTHRWEEYRLAAKNLMELEALRPRYVSEVRDRVLLSYHYERNYEGMVQYCEELMATNDESSFAWAVAKAHLGIALANKTVPDLDGAARIFDEVLAMNIQDHNEQHHISSVAANWRLHLANVTGDLQTQQYMIQFIQNEMPDNVYSATALASTLTEQE